MAIFMGLLAAAHWQSVLWASFERLFLILAVVLTAIAVVLIVWRSVASHWPDALGRSLAPVLLAVLALWTVTSPIDVRLGMVALGVAVGISIPFDRRQPPGGDGVRAI
jgi:hypothetical protein